MLGNGFDSVQDPPGISFNRKILPFLREQRACGSPASGRALTHRARAHAWLPHQLESPIFKKTKGASMFDSRFRSELEKKSGNNLLRMPFLSWTDRMSVDVKLLDNDIKKLVILLNELHEGILAGRAKPALERIFERLIRYTRVHFAHEEQLLVETGYPDAAIHEQEHDHLMARLRDLQLRFRCVTNVASSLEVVNLLKGWLFSHIQISDQEYVSHLKAKGVESILAAREIQNGIARKKPATGPGVAQELRPS
jgi:hemerythrin